MNDSYTKNHLMMSLFISALVTYVILYTGL